MGCIDSDVKERFTNKDNVFAYILFVPLLGVGAKLLAPRTPSVGGGAVASRDGPANAAEETSWKWLDQVPAGSSSVRRSSSSARWRPASFSTRQC